MNGKQVEKSHYDFLRYMGKDRWISVWHQLDELAKLYPERVLEIGPGPGVLKVVGARFGVFVETLDVDPNLDPQHVGSVTNLPFEDKEFDVVCAFQVLEHLPYESSLLGLSEMVRVSRKQVIISLPDIRKFWSYRFHVPLFGKFGFSLEVPMLGRKQHQFDGEHYWEINKKSYSLSRVMSDISRICRITHTYRVPENPYHRFFLLERIG